MAADGSIIIDTKIDDSGIPKQLGKMKTSLAKAAKTLALPIAITAGAIAAVGKVVSLMGELNKIYMVQASAERALSQAAANNPYLTGESVNNLKRYASELQKVSNYGDEVTIGLMTQLAAAGRTESEIQSIIKASADLAASGTTTFDGAVKNLNKTYSGLSGELGEVIPELKTLTAEQMKNGDAVDLIAKKYDGMAASVVDKSVQSKNAFGDLSEQMGRGLSPVVDGLSGLFGTLAAKMAEALSAANDLRDAENAIDSGTATAKDKITVYNEQIKAIENEMKTLIVYDELGQKIYTQAYKDKELQIKQIEDAIKRAEKQAEIEERLAHANSIGAKDAAEQASKELEATKKSNEKTAALVKAYSEWEKAQARANKAAELGVSTQEEQWEALQQAAKEYQEKLVDITLQYGDLGRESQAALALAKGVTGGVDLSLGLGGNISGVKLPMGIFDTFVNNAAELGDDWGKQLTGSMASSIDNTSIGVSEAMGGIVSNIGAAITTAVAIVKKIFAGIKAVAKFDPAAMYESFLEIIYGLTDFFAKIGSLPIYIEAGKKVLFEFMEGMLENKEANMETFRNVLTYMIKSAKEVLPAVISFAFIMMTDMATAIIEQLPLLVETINEIGVTIREGIIEMIPELIVAAVLILPAIITEIIKQIPESIKTLITMIPKIQMALLEGIIENLPELIMGIIEAMIYLFIGYKIDLVMALIEIFADIVKSIIDDVNSLFNGVAKSAIDGWLQGWKDGWNKMVQGIKDFCNGVIDKFKEILGIHSPSTVFAGFGGMIMEGLKNGITGAKIWDGIKATFTTIIDNIKKLFSAETWTDIGTKIKEGIGGAVTSVDTKAQEAQAAAAAALEAAKAKAAELAAAAKAKADELAAAAKAKAEEAAAKAKAAAAAAKITLANIGTGITSGVKKVGDWFSGLFHADGTNNFRGGTAIINEEGAEMVTLPSGSKIMTASATAQMQDRAISQLLAGMRMPSFATAGGGGSRNIMITTKVDAPFTVDGAVLGRLVFQNIDRAVV